MKLTFNFKNRKINLEVKKCNSLEKFTGLMFQRREKAPALLFEFEKPVNLAIHSFFVFFPFWAVWLDDKNNIVEEKIVKSWKFFVVPKREFCRLVEIPLNKKYRCCFPTRIRKV